MSTGNDTEMGALDRLKAIMEHRKITMRKLSGETGIPYRSVQNYLSGKHNMPLEVFRTICKELGVSADWILFGNVKLNHTILTDVLIETMGKSLPIPKIMDNGHLVLDSNLKPDKLDRSDLRRAAHTVAILISGRYDVKAEANYFSEWMVRDEDGGEG